MLTALTPMRLAEQAKVPTRITVRKGADLRMLVEGSGSRSVCLFYSAGSMNYISTVNSNELIGFVAV